MQVHEQPSTPTWHVLALAMLQTLINSNLTQFSNNVNVYDLQHVHVVPQEDTLEPISQDWGVAGIARHVTCPGGTGAVSQVHEQPSTPTSHVSDCALATF